MKWRIATIVLAVLLVVGGIFCWIEIANMTSDLNSLEANYAQLQGSYSSLESNYQTVQSEYQTVKSEYDTLQGSYAQLQSSYNTLEVENANLQSLLQQYEQVPHDYYSATGFVHHSNTYAELCHFLSSEFVLPRGYKANVFDCSESSAYLEWALENAGFDAQIAVGPPPWDQSSGYHAWVIAYTKEYSVAIEATALTGGYKFLDLFLFRTPGVVYSNDPLIPGWQNYYNGYDHLFRNTFEAIRYYGSTEEWNWWEGYWGFT